MNKLIQSTLSNRTIDVSASHLVFRILSWILTLTLLFLSSASYASSPLANDVHICEVLDYEEIRARNSRYAATKQTLDLNVGEPRTVRMIYFLPNDRLFRQEVVDSMKVTIRQVQTFFADQMEAHGHGRKTFRFETDAQGEPVVHRVDGGHPESYYYEGGRRSDIEQKIDFSANNVYLIVRDNGTSSLGPGLGGIGSGDRDGGFATVPDEFHWKVVAHEFGHAFGLNHDWRDGDYIMSYGAGGGWNRLSECAAEFLSVHPFFNPDIPDKSTPPPTIELFSSPEYPTGSTSVSVQLKVSDPDGLHQVFLFNFGTSGIGVKMCKGLNGETEAVVEFDYDGVIPSSGNPHGTGTSLSNPFVHLIYLEAVDTGGNVGAKSISLSDVSDAPATIATLKGHMAGVFSVSFSPDGKMLASGAGDYAVKLWDTVTKTNIATFEGHGSSVSSVSFSPDGATLASGSFDATVILWDIATRTNIATLRHTLPVRSMSFSPDGKMLASGTGNNPRELGIVKLWDVATKTNIATLEEHTGAVFSITFSPDGTTLAYGLGTGIVKLWDVATRTNIATLEGHTDIVLSVSFSPDGTILASAGSDDNTVKLWDVATRTNIATLEHSGNVGSLSFSPDGTILAVSASGLIKLWNVATETNIATFEGYTRLASSLSFSPDGTILASSSYEGAIMLWDTSELLRPRPFDLVKISGDNQRGTPGAALANPLVVEVRDQYGNVLEGVSVSFAVTAGRGRLSASTDVTDANGRVQTTLTLGREQETNLVAVTASGIEQPVTFTSEVLGPQTLVKISGDEQEGMPGASLANPLVVEVKDQNGNVLEGIAVTFAITKGDGKLSIKTAVTDSSGRAQTMLTLGSDVGTNTVSVTVAGIEQPVTFTSEVLGPQTLVQISGDEQEGAPSAELANPLVVEVKDQNGNTLEGIAVTFAVTEGEGTLSIKTAMTDSSGRAQTMLTLGNSLETTIVAVTVAGIEQPMTFTIEALATPDFNGDDAVDFSDFLLFTAQFGFSQEDEGYQAQFDLDGDGMIGFGDFLIFANNFGNAGS